MADDLPPDMPPPFVRSFAMIGPQPVIPTVTTEGPITRTQNFIGNINSSYPHDDIKQLFNDKGLKKRIDQFPFNSEDPISDFPENWVSLEDVDFNIFLSTSKTAYIAVYIPLPQHRYTILTLYLSKHPRTNQINFNNITIYEYKNNKIDSIRKQETCNDLVIFTPKFLSDYNIKIKDIPESVDLFKDPLRVNNVTRTGVNKFAGTKKCKRNHTKCKRIYKKKYYYKNS